MRIVLIIIFAGLLSACGFQLRGANVLPPDLKNLYIQAPVALRDEIRVYLDGTDTKVIDNRQGADVILILSDSHFDRRVLSVDPNTGKEREYELIYSLNYLAKRASGKTLLNSQRLTVRRDYVFDRDAVLGKSREQGVLRNEMLRDAVQQILFRLQSATS